MKRTLGTINTERGIARIEHDSEAGTLIAVFADRDGRDASTEPITDYRATKSWANAREQVIALYGGAMRGAKHDIWVLCLRPIAALRNATSEEHMQEVAR